MRTVLKAALMAAVFSFAVGGYAQAAKRSDKPAAAPAPSADAPKNDKDIGDLQPFPADAHVTQVTHVAGKTLSYTATVGSLPVYDEKGKKVGEVVFTAYTLDGVADRASRPVTFAFNGGPGASSVYLNFGAIGPKRVQFGAAGDSASDSPRLQDNPSTWLDFTDLVFIDPVGTGFSRSLVPLEETKKRFWSVQTDIEYLSRVVYDWLLKNGRMASPKYVAGESYGGFRGPRITHYLQTTLGVGVNGLVLVSPYLDSEMWTGSGFSPMGYVDALPTLTAANRERHGQALSPESMKDVEDYARGELLVDLLKGARDQAAVDRIVAKVSGYTGMDPAMLKRWGGRIDTRPGSSVLREMYRDQAVIGSWYDPNVTSYDPFPWAPQQQSGDPILDSIVAPTTSAMVDFDTRIVGWKVEGAYHALSQQVGANWENGHGIANIESVTDLRQAVALDPKLRVLIVNGYDDLACPYFAERLIVDQMPKMGDPGRIQAKAYPGGHMFYSRPDSGAAFRHDVMTLVFGVS
jgi:carboxypeptidase C (cathepsin A)